MKKYTKNLALMTALMVILAVVFTGCGTNLPSNEPSGSTPSASAETAKEPVKLTFYSWEEPLKANNEAVARAYTGLNPNVTIEFQYPTGNNAVEFQKKIDLLLAGGENVDIFGQQGPAIHKQKVGQGMLLSLDDLLSKEGVKAEDIYSPVVRIDGKVWALPADVKTGFVMINKDQLDAAGLPAPPLNWTWEDYREYAMKLTHGEGAEKHYGSFMMDWIDFHMTGMLSSKNDFALYKEDGSLNFDDPNLKSWLQYRYDLEQVDKAQVPFTDVVSQKLAYRDMFFTGRVSMVVTGTYFIPEIADIAKYPHDFVTTFAFLPRWKDGPEGRVNVDPMFWCINKESKNIDEAYKFIRYYTTDGMYTKAASFTAQKGADTAKILDTLIKGNEKYYDVPALKAVLTWDKKIPNVRTLFPAYGTDIETMFKEECDKFMVGGQTIEKTIDNLNIRGADIIAKFK